jgi:hypothetical protein
MPDIKQGDDYAAGYAQTTGDITSNRDMTFSRTLNKKKRQLNDPILDVKDVDLSPEVAGKVCCDGEVIFSPYQVPGLRYPNTPPVAILELGTPLPETTTFDLALFYDVDIPVGAFGYQWGYYDSLSQFVEYKNGEFTTSDGLTDYLIDVRFIGGLRPTLIIDASASDATYGIDKIYFRIKSQPPGVPPIKIDGEEMTTAFKDFGTDTLYITLPRVVGISDYVFEIQAESMGQSSSTISTDIIRYIVGDWDGIPY